MNLADTLVADGQWRRYQVPIACFALDVNALGRVFSPMVLAMGAGDSLELSNVAIEEAQERGSDLAPSSILLSDCGQDAF